jgi:hypothetical protein
MNALENIRGPAAQSLDDSKEARRSRAGCAHPFNIDSQGLDLMFKRLAPGEAQHTSRCSSLTERANHVGKLALGASATERSGKETHFQL